MAKSFDEMTDRDIQELCDQCIAEVAIGKVEVLDSAVNIAMEAADRLMKRNNEKPL